MSLEAIMHSGLAIAIATIVIGQIFIAKREKRRKFEDEQLSAYLAFLDSVTASAFTKDKAARQEALKAATMAKTKICICGSKETIKALANYERTGTVIREEKCTNAFLILLANMRKDIGANSDKIDAMDLRRILLGSEDE